MLDKSLDPLKRLEKLFNWYLHLDPEVDMALSKLLGKVVAIRISTFCFYCLIRQEKVELLDCYEGVVDLSLQADLSDYLRLVVEPDFSLIGRLQMHGNVEVAQNFKNLFSNLYIDWEERLARIVGDNLAYPLARFWRGFSGWVNRSANNLLLNLIDYLQVEKELLLTPYELNDFLARVDQMRDDVERLELRIQRLKKQAIAG